MIWNLRAALSGDQPGTQKCHSTDRSTDRLGVSLHGIVTFRFAGSGSSEQDSANGSGSTAPSIVKIHLVLGVSTCLSMPFASFTPVTHCMNRSTMAFNRPKRAELAQPLLSYMIDLSIARENKMEDGGWRMEGNALARTQSPLSSMTSSAESKRSQGQPETGEHIRGSLSTYFAVLYSAPFRLPPT